jgi:hypothetical protein
MKWALTTSRTEAVMVARPSPLAAFCLLQFLITEDMLSAGLRREMEVRHVS